MRMRMLAVALPLLLTPTLAHAAQTIVGTWAPDPRECTPVGGLVTIGPMRMDIGEEYSCGFRDVARSGYVVTWHGYCETHVRSDERTTVVAEQSGPLLYIRFNGAQNGPFLRCTPQD